MVRVADLGSESMGSTPHLDDIIFPIHQATNFIMIVVLLITDLLSAACDLKNKPHLL